MDKFEEGIDDSRLEEFEQTLLTSSTVEDNVEIDDNRLEELEQTILTSSTVEDNVDIDDSRLIEPEQPSLASSMVEENVDVDDSRLDKIGQPSLTSSAVEENIDIEDIKLEKLGQPSLATSSVEENADIDDSRLEELEQPSLASLTFTDADSMRNVYEEMGTDFAVGNPNEYTKRSEDKNVERAERTETKSANRSLGYVSLAFAIASWFLWPVLLGATAAVLGFISYRQGAKGLGGWAMAFGIAAVALNLIIVPFYYAIT